MAATMGDFARAGFLNFAGGCCGTTPDHIAAIAEAVDGVAPRRLPTPPRHTRLSGLEPLTIGPDSLFVNVGERTNVTGSRRFARLIGEGDYETAIEVARQQVRGGAQVIDVNMDEGLLDSEAAMVTFLNLLAAEPEIARVPFMIDSSRWEVMEAGLRCVQGKAVVNSISLKDGEEVFREQARLVRRYGAAVIIMAFDEQGQADTAERKVEISTRAYDILVNQEGFPPEDIIFDPNIFAVATGIAEHDEYAVAYFDAVARIKEALPHALVSGGVSNVSFSFRGSHGVREAMHSAFLYPRRARRDGHGDRQRGRDRGLRRDPGRAAHGGRGRALQPRRGSHRAPDRAGRPVPGERGGRRRGPVMAGGAGRTAAAARAGAWDHRLHRGGHGGGARGGREGAPRHRRAADGGDEHRGRPLRRREDVPAAGGEERPGDEAGGGVSGALPGTREAGRGGGAFGRADRDGDGQGRRARHRQEHRRGRVAV